MGRQRRLGDVETRRSSRDYPRLRLIDHCDEHPEDLVVRLIQRCALISFQVAALHREFDPDLGFGSFAFGIG